MNAISVLSGDHVGARPVMPPGVMFPTTLPSAFITQMSVCPSRWLVKASLSPSTFQTGSPSARGWSVSCAKPDPSSRTTKISRFPVRVDSNAMRPSPPGKAASLI